MTFGSLDECVAYIKKQMDKTSGSLAKDSKNEAEKIIGGELKGYSYSESIFPYPFQGSTGDTKKTPTIISTGQNGFVVELVDNGSWYSVLTGEHYFSILALESGTTWNRGKTNIMDKWRTWNSSVVPNKYKSYMNSFGVPVE